MKHNTRIVLSSTLHSRLTINVLKPFQDFGINEKHVSRPIVVELHFSEITFVKLSQKLTKPQQGEQVSCLADPMFNYNYFY